MSDYPDNSAMAQERAFDAMGTPDMACEKYRGCDSDEYGKRDKMRKMKMKREMGTRR